MKLRIMTKRQLAAEEAGFRKQHLVNCDLMKLTGRCLTVMREAREYLKFMGPPEDKLRVSGKVCDVTSYEDLMSHLNALLNRE